MNWLTSLFSHPVSTVKQGISGIGDYLSAPTQNPYLADVGNLTPEQKQGPSNLRNILGRLSDAFLVQAGHDPSYLPGLQSEALGRIMQADPEHVQQTALQAGLPADVVNQFVGRQLQQAQVEGLQNYRKQQALERFTPYVGTMVQRPKTPEQYAQVYNHIDQIAKRIDPSLSALDFPGIVPPDQYTGPESVANAGRSAESISKEELLRYIQELKSQTSGHNAETRADAQIKSAGIRAGGTVGAATAAADARKYSADQQAGASRYRTDNPPTKKKGTDLLVQPPKATTPKAPATAPTPKPSGKVYIDNNGRKITWDGQKWVDVK